MATNFKNVVTKEIGKLEVPLYTTAVGVKATIIGMSLANLTNSVVSVDILMDSSDSTKGFIVKGLPVAPGASLKPIGKGEKIVMNPNNSIIVKTDTNDSIDVVTSLVEIT